MKLLLDTNIVIWAGASPERLAKVRPVLEDVANPSFISAVVAWEIAIKHALGRLALPLPPATLLPLVCSDLDASPLAITQEHALAVAELPALHGDPFDRLLVAQAMATGATLLTADAVLAEYPCETLLA